MTYSLPGVKGTGCGELSLCVFTLQIPPCTMNPLMHVHQKRFRPYQPWNRCRLCCSNKHGYAVVLSSKVFLHYCKNFQISVAYLRCPHSLSHSQRKWTHIEEIPASPPLTKVAGPSTHNNLGFYPHLQAFQEVAILSEFPWKWGSLVLGEAARMAPPF